MKYILPILIAASISINANAANELHIVNDNGDAEIFIPATETDNSTTYISSGIIADVEPNTVTIIEPKKPTIKIYQPEPSDEVTVPVTITNDYEPLVDTGGDYDQGADVYRPELKFKSY